MVLLASVAEAPMHPYRMQQLIKERGKDKIANVAQRNSVYQTIEHLHRAGLIAVRATARDERRRETCPNCTEHSQRGESRRGTEHRRSGPQLRHRWPEPVRHLRRGRGARPVRDL